MIPLVYWRISLLGGAQQITGGLFGEPKGFLLRNRSIQIELKTCQENHLFIDRVLSMT